MKNDSPLVRFAVDHPRLVTAIMVAATVVLAALIPLIRIDTDPENMLSEKEAVRIFHNQMKQTFHLHDMVVVGIVNEKNRHGVFNPQSLEKIYQLTRFILEFRWQDGNDGADQDRRQWHGVVPHDVMAPSTLDHIGSGGPGVVKFEWLMPRPPKDQAQADIIKQRIMANPLLRGTLVSEDGKALCLYIPLTAKDLSYRLYSRLKQKITGFAGDDRYYITGLPVAEDTFGVEMFIQMAISAPTAMVLIFILMLIFFRKITLIVSPMIVAMVSVICTMGLLIGSGYTVHIMSSMIPIFVMPIAVLDSIHILSEFFDRYQETKDRRKTILRVMRELFLPMLYTSLTSAAGFASLALTPIPPVQVFGVFVAFGIMLAWLLTVTFVPAYTTFISERSLANFGAGQPGQSASRLDRILAGMGRFTFRHPKSIIAGALAAAVIAVYGIFMIEINDNPVKWFTENHPIRVADRVLNRHFGGTYMAYLALAPDQPMDAQTAAAGVKQTIRQSGPDDPVSRPALSLVDQALTSTQGLEQFFRRLIDGLWARADREPEPQRAAWERLAETVEKHSLQQRQPFKRPELLNYIVGLQDYLHQAKVVGKTSAVTDLVRKVNQELHEGQTKFYRIPDSLAAVGQCLISFQNSHDPDDLWHLVTPHYNRANVWVQMKSGDNKEMEHVVAQVRRFFTTNPPPVPLRHEWFGLTYINVIWQDKMVSGMLQAFLGSFLVVFIMMTVLFRSPLWGILSMIPLTVTIAFIYGVIGLTGKDYDMPVAVLSSLTLGLAVDFAIHFLARARNAYDQTGNWEQAIPLVFGEPARAISRNIIVIAVGFTPLLLAPLVPYQTVGLFLANILLLSGIATLYLLPPLITVLQRRLFTETRLTKVTCHCATCLVVAIAGVVLIALNLHQYAQVSWHRLTILSMVAIPAAAVWCSLIAKRQKCNGNAN